MFPGRFAGQVKCCWLKQLQGACPKMVLMSQTETSGFAAQSDLALFFS